MYSCTMPVPDPGGGGGDETVSVLFFCALYVNNGLVEVLGLLLWFGVVWGVSKDRTTVMLTDQIRKRVWLTLWVALQIHGQFCFAL